MKTRPQCPNCDSFKSNPASPRGVARTFGLVCIVAGFLTLWALIGIPIFALGVVLVIVSIFLPENRLRHCRSCGNFFTP